MERLGLAVIRAYDLGLLARALPTGRRYVGGAGLLGHVARWALAGRLHRGTVYCPYVYRRCFMAVNPPICTF